jgi:hypothetical protein
MPPEGEPQAGGRSARSEIRTDQIVDLPTGRAAFEAIDHASLFEHEQRGHLANPEVPRELRAPIGVEVDDTQSLLLGHFHPGDETLHLPRDAAGP